VGFMKRAAGTRRMLTPEGRGFESRPRYRRKPCAKRGFVVVALAAEASGGTNVVPNPVRTASERSTPPPPPQTSAHPTRVISTIGTVVDLIEGT
jgi:hypothetical protein